ncbi:MAG: hypothetical protein IKL56_03675 [Bacteroidaceae bacterium]|nr:hypothetical protein [Bacteroidaceae bacterium]
MAEGIRKSLAGILLRASKLLLSLFALSLASCSGTLFHEYRALDDTCWSRSDTLMFIYDRSHESGVAGYELTFEARVDASYAYKNIVASVQVNGKLKAENGKLKTEIFADTLVCEVYDGNGNPNGATAGILYQVSSEPIYIDAIEGDTLFMRVSHIMDNDELGGVYDVGLRICSSSGRGQRQFSGM